VDFALKEFDFKAFLKFCKSIGLLLDIKEKGNSSKRMMFFIKSRLYYLKKYSGYNFAQLTSLKISYLLLYLTHFIKAAFIK
jgi:hypothetical protein